MKKIVVLVLDGDRIEGVYEFPESVLVKNGKSDEWTNGMQKSENGVRESIRAGKNKKFAMYVLSNLAKKGSSEVLEDVWRKECERMGMPNNRFREAKLALLRDGLIRMDGPVVELV